MVISLYGKYSCIPQRLCHVPQRVYYVLHLLSPSLNKHALSIYYVWGQDTEQGRWSPSPHGAACRTGNSRVIKHLTLNRAMVRVHPTTRNVVEWTSSESQSWAREHWERGLNSVWEVRDEVSRVCPWWRKVFFFFQNANNQCFLSSF